MNQPEIEELVILGVFPSSPNVNLAVLERQQELLRRIRQPVSEADARQVLLLFGPDDYFGLAWTVLHLIESTPGWPIKECLDDARNEWIARLGLRAESGSQT